MLKGIRRKTGRRISGIAIPVSVLIACLFFFLSVISWLQVSLSSEKQAEKYVEQLFTVRRETDLEKLYESGMPGVYDSWKDRVTETGSSALASCGMPYILLFQDFSAEGLTGQVERTYVKRIVLSDPEGENREPDPKKEVFDYQAEVVFYLEKGVNVLAPVREAVFEGEIALEKKGLIDWKLADFSL